MESLEHWACVELDKLGIPDAGDIVRYLQPIEDAAEVEDYLGSMLDMTQHSHQRFIKEFVKRQGHGGQGHGGQQGGGYSKEPFKMQDVGNKGYGNKKKQKNSKDNNESFNKNDDKYSGVNKSNQSQTSSADKKKSKFVSLYSEEGRDKEIVLLRGRHRCDCQASKHKLINNCLQCGRIICEQEGSGPCPFCGNLVMSKEEKEVMNRGSKKSEALMNKLTRKENSHVKKKPPNGEQQKSDLQKAIDHKNRLLEFDQTSEKRTKVFDDENDYFQLNSKWISKSDKVKLQKKEEEYREKKFDRQNKKMTIDLFGRKIVAEDNEPFDMDDPLIKEIIEGKSKDIFSAPDREESGPKVQVNRPEYLDTGVFSKKSTGSKFNAGNAGLRVQDRELLEMSDEGMCLSMHQPWASLLVAGIKIHEGRMWYSSHRGRLWIASAAKQPTPDDIKQVEHMYNVILKDDYIKFPKNYPTGCLLGCVDVVDVLPQEEYRTKYPDGESDSPYVFVCENPQEMFLKFPMKGQHKIYKLDTKIHQAAKRALRQREE